jgi:DNA-binding NtrC family response regulator
MSFATLLVVDDDGALRIMLHHYFSLAGYGVLLAETGHTALEVLRRASVDVILTDLNMPEMDGRAFATALRGMGNNTPIIVMTGARDSIDVDAIAYLRKPFDLQKAHSLVRAVVDAARCSRPASSSLAK